MKLQLFLRDNLNISRRKAADLIKAAVIIVNGKVAEIGTEVSDKDRVVFNKVEIPHQKQKLVYIALNKPAGYLTSKTDPFGRKTVYDLLPKDLDHVFPVGRLDYDTEGLLLLTNDGQFAYQLTHPKYEVQKKYLVHLNGLLKAADKTNIEKGVQTEIITTSPAQIEILGTRNYFTELYITIHEGKNREVRKIFETCGLNVIYLQRVQVGKLNLFDLNISTGMWTFISPDAV